MRGAGARIALALVLLFLSFRAFASWTPAASLPAATGYHTATPLPNGKVLVVGGWDGTTYRNDSVLYDPAANTMTPAGFVPGARGYLHTATLLRDGRVLVAGGLSGSSYVTVLAIYDPASNAWSDGGAIVDTRYWHTATLLGNGKVLLAGGLGFPQVSELVDPVSRVSSPAPAPATARYDHTATLLPNGKVLLVGGAAPSNDAELASAELFDPATNTWAPAASLGSARFGHTATLLPNGKVMVTGGRSASAAFGSTELYDPATNTWSPAAPMSPRFDHAASLLPGGRVLVSGGMNASFDAVAVAELYDPATNQWYAAPAMGQARLAHTSTLLATGRVFVAGGSGAPYRSSTELYDPAAATWSTTGALGQGRQRAVATLLPDGGALVAGGFGSVGVVLATAERFDPAAGTWSPRASMATARQAATLTPLADGKLLVIGGSSASGVTPTTGALASAERYDPATNAWSPAGGLATPRYLHTATLLLDGRVLVVGGENNGTALASVEIYEPGGNVFVAGPPLAAARRSHAATLLASGKVLVAGGTSGSALAAAELYDPVTNTWSAAGSLATPRYAHTATLLPDGRVLAAGGQGAAVLASAERYDPATNAWSATGAMATARQSHSATLLPSGHVLVVGAEPTGAGAERYDPVSGSFSAEPAPTPGRSLHAAVLLPSGSVLVTGGWKGAAAVATAEVYDPGRAPVPARQPQLASASALVVPGDFQATGSGFLPVVTASDGGTADSASSSPVFELQRVEDGQRRYVVNNAAQPNTDTSFRGIAPSFPPGPLLVRTWVNGVPSASRMARAPAPPSAPGAPVATGGTFATVTFTPASYDGGVPIQSYVATGSPGGVTGTCFGACTSITVFAPPGTYTFVVQARNAAGLGGASAASNAVTVAGLPTQTSVGATIFGLRFLDPVTLQANVSASGPPPTGTVAFFVDDVPVPGCAAVPLAAGAAQCSLPAGLPVGQRALKATFAGGSGYAGSVGTNTLTIGKGLTDSYVSDLATRFTFVGQPVQVTARVLPDLGPPNGPTGTITVGDGLASCTVPAPGPGACTLVPTTVGLQSIVATYPGDGNWAASTPRLATALTVMAPFAATARPSLITSRSWHSATLLLDGRLLVAGGISGTTPQVAYATAEIYDPATRSWSPTGTLASPRWGHGAIPLHNGRVLVAGGTNAVSSGALLPTGELWDPASGAWIPTAPLFTPRTRPVLVQLDDGRVMVVGGTTNGTASGATASVELYDPSTNTFTPTGSLATPREGHTATRLADGSVLVAGGRDAAGNTLATAERYDPSTGTWAPAGSLATARRDAAATLLDDGTVLVVAGANGTFTPLASAERYDPAVDAWEPAGSILGPRIGHSLSRLPNGLAVVLGGSGGGGAPLDAWFYDPATKTWTASGAMPAFRYFHTATWLANGELLIVGGAPQNAAQNVFAWTPATAGWQSLASLPTGVMLGTMTPMAGDRVMVAGGASGVFCCDLRQTFFFDESLRTWTTGPSMKAERYRHTATRLADNSVLVVGGAGAGIGANPVERYDPRVNAWLSAAPLPARTRHTATLLHNGRVLVTGGQDGNNATLAQAWIYDPVQDAWSAAASMSTPRQEHAATLLPNGTVLVTGGANGGTYLASAEVYDPATNAWSPAGVLPSGRTDHAATLLANGRVLVAGGYTGSSRLASAAMYNPATNAWTAVPDMAFPRWNPVAVRLADGTVLVAGGDDTGTTAERYFPLDNVWRSAGAGLPARTMQHMAVELSDGSVLVAGGRPTGLGPNATAAVSRFDPGYAPRGSQGSGGSVADPYLLPSSALVLENGGFAPASTASGGGVADSPSNVPVVEILRPDGSARRVIPAAQVESFGPTDYVAKIGALAGVPTGPVRVRAWVNGRLGTSASSRMATAPGRLAAPVALGGAKALLSFVAASYTGGAIVLQYTATASPGGATASCPRPCDKLEFAGLAPGTYTFTIVQQTAVGTSPASLPSNAVAIQATPIDVAPATLPVPAPSQPYGPVQFTASNGTAPYTFSVSSGELPPGLSLSAAGVLLGTPVGGGSFTFTVRARDSRTAANGGPLAGERTYTLTTDFGALPGAPQSVAAVPGKGRAYVTFAPPANPGGSAITGYRVVSNPAGGFDVDAGTTSLTHVVTGLTNGVAYTFTVEASNTAGTGPASGPSAPVTPGVPTLALSGPSPVDFGAVAPGSASQATTLVLTNPGPFGAALSPITTSGDFIVSHTCGSVLLPGSCGLNVQFVPSAVGPRAGTLTIPSDASGSPILRPLQGTGGTPATCAGFGDVAANDGFCSNVEWLVNRQITTGCRAGLYCPAAPVSREQMAAFMTRLGTALTPAPLLREQLLAVVDVDAGPVVCITGDHTVGTSPRTAHVDAVLSAQSSAGGDASLALHPVASFDGGATWSPLGALPVRKTIPSLQWGSARTLHALDLVAGHVVRFGLRLARDSLQGSTDLAAARCVLRVRFDNRNGSGSPRDPR